MTNQYMTKLYGFVVDVGYSGTFGNYVVTQDKKGVQIKYAYLQSISVANGQEVTTDTVIGTTGSTGSATGTFIVNVKQSERAKKPLNTVFQEICRHEMLGDFSADNYLNLENLQKSS